MLSTIFCSVFEDDLFLILSEELCSTFGEHPVMNTNSKHKNKHIILFIFPPPFCNIANRVNFLIYLTSLLYIKALEISIRIITKLYITNPCKSLNFRLKFAVLRRYIASMAAQSAAMVLSRGREGLSTVCSGKNGTWMNPARTAASSKWCSRE